MYTQQNSIVSTLFFIIDVIKPFRRFVAGQFLVTVIWSIDMSLRPYLTKVILDKIPTILMSQTFDMLLLPITLYIVIEVIVVITFRFYEWVLLHFHPNLKKHIGIILISRMMNHSQNFYQNHSSGKIVNKINDVTNGIPNILNTFIDQFFSHALALSIAIYTICLVDLKFAIGLIIWIAIFLTVSIRLSGKAKKLAHKAAEVYSGIIGNIVDILGNIGSIRLFGGKMLETKYLNENYEYSVKAEQVRDWFFMKIHMFQESSFIIFQSICFWWLITGIKSQTITPGDFALILILNISIVNCLHNLSRNIRAFTESFGKVTQGLNIIHSILEIEDKAGAKDIVITKGEIFFEKVQFYYNKSKPIFENKSIKIYSGQKVALVGYSGSGKSTFVNLILRLFDVTRGRILIDNQDIRDISQESLRQAISIIPQDQSLFNRTLIENIRYGRVDASDDEVIEAAKRAHAHKFICELPEGYQTLVGERGVKISGGERQRIAIARAILKNAPILILDEATSQLDSVTEHQIQEILLDIMKGKTTIVITHRLPTILHMDRILVFDKGKILQDGQHKDLIIKTGLYKTLWDTTMHYSNNTVGSQNNKYLNND
jgi:ATP-binding cassette subfamily B protein